MAQNALVDQRRSRNLRRSRPSSIPKTPPPRSLRPRAPARRNIPRQPLYGRSPRSRPRRDGPPLGTMAPPPPPNPPNPLGPPLPTHPSHQKLISPASMRPYRNANVRPPRSFQQTCFWPFYLASPAQIHRVIFTHPFRRLFSNRLPINIY